MKSSVVSITVDDRCMKISGGSFIEKTVLPVMHEFIYIFKYFKVLILLPGLGGEAFESVRRGTSPRAHFKIIDTMQQTSEVRLQAGLFFIISAILSSFEDYVGHNEGHGDYIGQRWADWSIKSEV